ncbi:MAG: CAP domain-containing protein [Myxococcota bacterium]
MMRSLAVTIAAVLSISCTSDEGSGDGEAMGTLDDGSMDDDADAGADAGAMLSCEEVTLAPLDEDPDQGFIDVTDFCLEEINRYRAMEGLEPFTIQEDARCCSALEARQAWLDGTHHNGDYCDWRAQGAAGGGRNPNGDARKSMEWVPRLFYQEKGDTFEESGGHYQAMMRPEPRPIACGWYGHDRDNHRVVVNYW